MDTLKVKPGDYLECLMDFSFYKKGDIIQVRPDHDPSSINVILGYNSYYLFPWYFKIVDNPTKQINQSHSCQDNLKEYVGIMNRYHYCTVCDAKIH